MQWRWLIVCGALACQGKKTAPPDPVPQTVEQPSPPASDGAAEAATSQAGPDREQAAELFLAFSNEILAGNLSGAKKQMWIPDGFSDKQIDFYLRQMSRPSHLSSEGVSAVLEAEFGPLADRFGEHAEVVASGIGVPKEMLFAFGDTSAAAILHWDGQTLRVAAVHSLSKP